MHTIYKIAHEVSLSLNFSSPLALKNVLILPLFVVADALQEPW